MANAGNNLEIERKFLIRKDLTADPAWVAEAEALPHHRIEQAYLSTSPTLRIRRMDETFFLTFKSRGTDSALDGHREVEFEISREDYEGLSPRAEGRCISKIRYYKALENGLTMELDHFLSPSEGIYEDLWMAEVEFPDRERAASYKPHDWFGTEVSEDRRYYNSEMSKG